MVADDTCSHRSPRICCVCRPTSGAATRRVAAVNQRRHADCRTEITRRREITSRLGPPRHSARAGPGRAGLAWVVCCVVGAPHSAVGVPRPKLTLQGTHERIIRWCYVLLRHVHGTFGTMAEMLQWCTTINPLPPLRQNPLYKG